MYEPQAVLLAGSFWAVKQVLKGGTRFGVLDGLKRNRERGACGL
jgi:hypothetical protein